MLAGYAGPVAAAALSGGSEALAAIRLEVGRPLRPMLAASAPDIDAAWEQAGDTTHGVVVDGKLDGIRLQAHRDGDEVRLFTRSLDDITDRLPEVVEAVLALPVETVVIDGEAIALDASGRPRPFQETASRTMSSTGVDELRARVPVTPYFFDLLHVDGQDLLEVPASERFARLAELVPSQALVPRITAATPAEAGEFFDRLVSEGHEGVVVKSPSAPYAAGRRGAGWVKVKPRHTLDLVVLAVEWGSGRRQGWLSNIHLGARDPDTGGFVMLGKTFKGMTDEMLAWQTERFTELADRRHRRLRRQGRAPNRSWRSPSTASRPPRATPAGWRCASPGSCATETTRRPTRLTPWRQSAHCAEGAHRRVEELNADHRRRCTGRITGASSPSWKSGRATGAARSRGAAPWSGDTPDGPTPHTTTRTCTGAMRAPGVGSATAAARPAAPSPHG